MNPLDLGDCVRLLKAIGDSTRLRVILSLAEGAKHVGAINSTIGIEASLLSHHLRVLKEAGLIRNRRDGKAVLYSLAERVQVDGETGTVDLGPVRLSPNSLELDSCTLDGCG